MHATTSYADFLWRKVHASERLRRIRDRMRRSKRRHDAIMHRLRHCSTRFLMDRWDANIAADEHGEERDCVHEILERRARRGDAEAIEGYAGGEVESLAPLDERDDEEWCAPGGAPGEVSAP